MWPEEFDIDVSRESQARLEVYHALLLKWQRAINLVSPKTLDEAWVRHFADSAQLNAYIPDNVRNVMDWGSGAGFAGLVLAVMRGDIDFTMVESDERKCQFMRTVSRETNATVRIENERIESVVKGCETIPDLITARALKPVKTLLDFSKGFVAIGDMPDMLLLKGAAAEQELDEARIFYDFEVARYPSCTSGEGVILYLSNIRQLA